MANKGFLLVTMQPPPTLEEEFNAWYDTEHVPERLAVPGILTALRFVCIDGHPRYLAMYDLENFQVMDSPAYLKVAHDKSSPWTKRVTSRVKVWRSAGSQIYPGTAVTKASARVQLIRFRGLKTTDEKAIVEGVKAHSAERTDVIQARVLAFDTGAAGIDYMAFVECNRPSSGIVDFKAFRAYATEIDLVNWYAPY